MAMSRNRWRKKVAALAASALVAAPLWPAGFSIFEQGAKATGMAGAFTALADDPSAMFYNVAGIAFQKERAFQAGFTWITSTEAEFRGASPFPGPGATGEQVALSEFPAHFYWVEPVNRRWTFGLAVNTPFGLTTEWDNPDEWPGRFVAEYATLRAVDVNPNLAFLLTPRLGIGFGAIVRISDVELRQRQAIVNPFALQAVEVAKVGLESDFGEGYGWQLGALWRYNNSFSVGLRYRSKVTIDYEGDARFTQVSTGNPILDALVASQIPFGLDVPVTTEIEFPNSASLGLLFAVSPTVRVETDFNWTGWSSFDTLEVRFGNSGLPPLIRPENWDDTYHYRLGVLWMRPGGREWRFGYVTDENPIPDATLGPLLADSDRTGWTIGYGWEGRRIAADLALMYLPFDDRRILATEVQQVDNFYGIYETTAWLLGFDLSW